MNRFQNRRVTETVFTVEPLVDVMVFVVDTNVLIHGRGSFPFDKAYLVPEVLQEVKSEAAENMIENVDYDLVEPSEDSIRKVEEKSESLNSPTSQTDEKLLALAIDKGGTLLTDDKALQNLALHMQADFKGFIDDPLEKRFEWVIVCKNCGNRFSGSSCSMCGSSASKRKQVRYNSR